MRNELNELIDLLNNCTSEEEQENYIYNIFQLKDVNLIDPSVFKVINVFMEAIAKTDKDTQVAEYGGKLFALLTAQLLSIAGLLADKNPITDSSKFLQFKDIKAPPGWAEDILDSYLYNYYVKRNREEFCKSIAALTDDSAILTSASNFIYQYTRQDLTEDEILHRDLGLMNLLRLSIGANMFKEVKEILLSQLKIDASQFISDNIQLFLTVIY